jgi:hypothetical protein
MMAEEDVRKFRAAICELIYSPPKGQTAEQKARAKTANDVLEIVLECHKNYPEGD